MNIARRFDPDAPLFWAFAALLVWAPIPLGSNRPWAWGFLEAGAFALAAAWIALWATGRVATPRALHAAWPAAIFLAAWLAIQALHVVPLPASWVAALSPAAARAHALAADVGAAPSATTLSIDPEASRVSLLKSLAYAAIFFLALSLVARRSRLLALARVLVYAAVIHSVYAVLMHLAGGTEEWFGTLIPHGDSASGTYANRNHFAGYLEMSLALGIGLLIAGLSDRKADTWKKFLRLTLEWVLSPRMVLRLALCVLVIALTTTHSRMGNTAFFASLLVAGAIGIALSRHATRNTVILLASLVAIDLFIVGSWFGVEKLAQRLEHTTAVDMRVREDPAAYTVPLIRDYALFGSGPGSFHVAFPRYRPATVLSFYDYTHNDYAQFASESGIPGFVALGGFTLLCLGAALAAQWRRRDPLMRGMSFACIMGVAAILIHSWVDFNLQIPANAAYFVLLLALGWVSLFLDRRDSATDARAHTRGEG
ncbi:MAG TPA: O-antigen ligase family protein [Usitatibacter sp.]|nr:O-antigen ligase family protein [Usitatibacter sp.]